MTIRRMPPSAPPRPEGTRPTSAEPSRPAAQPARLTSAELLAKYGDAGFDAAGDAYTRDRSNAKPFTELNASATADLAAAVADLAAFEEMGAALKRFGGDSHAQAMAVTGAELQARHALLLSAVQLSAASARAAENPASVQRESFDQLVELSARAQEQVARATSPEAVKDADRFRFAQVAEWRTALEKNTGVDHGGELARALSALAGFHEAHAKGVPQAFEAKERSLASRVIALTERSAAEHTKQALRQQLQAHVDEQLAMPEDQRGISFSTWRDLAVPLRAVAMLEDVASKQDEAAAGGRVAGPVPTLTGLAAQLTAHMASAYLQPSAAGAALPANSRLCLTSMLAYATRSEASNAAPADEAAPGQSAASARAGTDTEGPQTFVPFKDLGDALTTLWAALPPELGAKLASRFSAAKAAAPGLERFEGMVRTLFGAR